MRHAVPLVRLQRSAVLALLVAAGVTNASRATSIPSALQRKTIASRPSAVAFPAEARQAVVVQIIEKAKSRDWNSACGTPSLTYREPALALVGLPRKYAAGGVIADRSAVFLVRAFVARDLPSGAARLLLRASSGSRLFADDKLVATTSFVSHNAEGHEAVPRPVATRPDFPIVPTGHQQVIADVNLPPGLHRFRFEALVGSDGLRHEIGQPLVAIAAPGDGKERFELLVPEGAARVPFSGESWSQYEARARERLAALDTANRRQMARREDDYWQMRHQSAREAVAAQGVVPVPASPSGWPANNAIDDFINARMAAANVRPAPLTDDSSFLRRVTLDTVGLLPTPEEMAAFAADRSAARREAAIDRLLADDRWADNWVGYWQDVLAENPGILKPELNNTGPFRWWIYEALFDNKPFDRFATELITMPGSLYYGGPAGFAMASQNDVPLADKAQIVVKAFLGLEMKCARCHDAPYHPFLQKDLLGLAAMLDNRPVKLPLTSTLALAGRGHKPLVKVTLQAGEAVPPHWPFDRIAPSADADSLLRNKLDFRERFAVLVTSGRNERFAQVIVNRLWKRSFGTGLVEPVDDWTDAVPSHPQLLAWLGRELIAHDFDLKHVARLIFNSRAYQRVPGNDVPVEAPSKRLFASPSRRRMTAEQIVDSLFAAVGKPFRSEPLTMDPEIRRGVTSFLNLGAAKRAWQFTSLSNDRDRPALALPVAQTFVDALSAFGWRDSRTNPITVRDEEPTALQPLLLSNGVLANRIVRLSDDSSLTQLAQSDISVNSLVEKVFERFLSRKPRPEEVAPLVRLLGPGYEQRRKTGAATSPVVRIASAVSWSNHLSPEATRIKLELERIVREGDPPTRRLDADWRERMEDMVWTVINSPEFVFLP